MMEIAIRVGLKIEIPIITPADTDPTFSETKIPWAFRNIPAGDQAETVDGSDPRRR